MSIILCNKLLCLTETCILYELDKYIRMTTVKILTVNPYRTNVANRVSS